MPQKAYIGAALKYPLLFVNGVPQYEYDDALIQQSIRVLLDTPVGSKLFLREYGSRCREVLFEPNDEVLEDMLQYFIAEAIGKWEKRISFVGVEFDRPKEDTIHCLISYRNLKSNEINSFIYPFYKTLKY